MLFMDKRADFCSDTAGLWGILGWIVLVLRIVIPLVLIILGMIDMGHAVIEDDEKAIGKAVGKLVRRFIAALLVFFVPLIVAMIFNAVLPKNENVNINGGADLCVNCLLRRNQMGNQCVAPYMIGSDDDKFACEKNVGKKIINGHFCIDNREVTKSEYES